jgi:SAM-dependent methyltransferase
MGIDYRFAKLILHEHKYRPVNGSILLIGRQTVLMTPELAIELVKAEGLEVRREAKIEIDHSTFGKGHGLITDRSFFSLFSPANVVALDISSYEGAEVIADLNQPLPSHLQNSADFIYNGSCLDNLFDPACALKNMSALLKPGGRIIHTEHGSPMQHAYIMYSPALFFDYYAINGFDDCRIYTLYFEKEILEPLYAFHWQPFYQTRAGKQQLTTHTLANNHHAVIYVVAEKGETSTVDKSPIQGMYRTMHGSSGDLYFRAFERFSSSKRPFPNLRLTPNLYQTPAGFSYLGVLENPQVYSDFFAKRR